MYRTHVLVCGGTGCHAGGSAQVIAALESEVKKAGLDQAESHDTSAAIQVGVEAIKRLIQRDRAAARLP